MNTCKRCGKSGDGLWLSKNGNCEECMDSLIKSEERHFQNQQHPPAPGMFNVWFGLSLTCLIISFICMLAISFGGGFQYVGGDAYNIQITASVATNWFILTLITSIIGSAQYLAEIIKYRK